MASYGMVIDLDKCSGCYSCFLVCRDEHSGIDRLPYAAAEPERGHEWVGLIEKERGRYPRVKVSYLPKMCAHCEGAPCVQAAGNGAVYRRPDGIVLIDPAKAEGRRELVSACPHRAIFWNEEKQLPQKCTLCAHLLDAGWKEPRCVEACPTGAMVFGDLDDPTSEVSKLIASGRTEEFHPEYNLRPRVRYIGLPKRFAAGTVVYGDTDECGVGAEVLIVGAGAERTMTANAFGDFEFEGLEVGDYVLTIRHGGYRPQTVNVSTKSDVYVGEIVLERE